MFNDPRRQRRAEMDFAYHELVERGVEPRFARDLVQARNDAGWTPEEREAIRKFCAGANHVIGYHFMCDHA